MQFMVSSKKRNAASTKKNPNPNTTEKKKAKHLKQPPKGHDSARGHVPLVKPTGDATRR